MKATTQVYQVTLIFNIEAATAREAIDRVTILNRGAIEPIDITTERVQLDGDDEDDD